MKRPEAQPGDNVLAGCLIGIVLIMFGLFVMIWPAIEAGLNLAVLR